MESFKRYKIWREEAEKLIKNKGKDADFAVMKKPAATKKVLVQFRFDNTGDKLFQLNIYLCWLLAWCGTL